MTSESTPDFTADPAAETVEPAVPAQPSESDATPVQPPAPSVPAFPWSSATLATALRDARERTLALFHRLQAAIGPNALPRYLPELSPPMWDLGHLVWQEGWLISRNPGLMAGTDDATRAPLALFPKADTWFNPKTVGHTARWNQPLPTSLQLVDWARRTREQSLVLLKAAARREAALPLFARVLEAELRLQEDWLGIAQTLGIDPGAAADDPAAVTPGSSPQDATDTAPTIDLAPVTWAAYLPFVDDNGYERRELWTDAGWAWRKRSALMRPRHLAERETPENGEHTEAPRRARFGQWVPLDLAHPVMHVSLHEAQAWCRWAGRRLPTDTEWRATQADRADFAWGAVWEWTLADEPGAVSRLIGASFATAPSLAAAPGTRAEGIERNDGFWGFRSAPALPESAAEPAAEQSAEGTAAPPTDEPAKATKPRKPRAPRVKPAPPADEA